jgi:hypothetical protein
MLQSLTANMKQVIHHGYVITVTTNSEKGVWRAHAIVRWDKGKFELDGEAGFPTEREAENHALELGKHWVNNQRQRLQGLS